MKKITDRSRFHVFLALVLSLSVSSAASADNYNVTPRLFAVTVPGLTREPKEFDIPIRFGEGKTAPIAQSDSWRIYGGTEMTQRPASLQPILVELHGTVENIRKIITRVMVRYYQNDKGNWQPLYQLNQEPLMVNTPQGWKPVFGTRESPEILGVMNRELPNPAGYRPVLDFKVQSGKISIDSWVVKQHQ